MTHPGKFYIAGWFGAGKEEGLGCVLSTPLTRHEVMHIGRLFPVALAAQADGSPREEDGRDQSPAHTQPSEYKGPVIGNVSVVPQRLEAANKRVNQPGIMYWTLLSNSAWRSERRQHVAPNNSNEEANEKPTLSHASTNDQS